jgi:hypothetical protein
MVEPTASVPDRRKVRAGLALVSIVVLVAIVLAVTVTAPAGRLLMIVIAAVAIIRAFLLTRSLRARPPA